MTIGITIRDGGNVPREISKILVRDGGNVQREISAIYVRDTNNTPRLVFNPSGSLIISVIATPDSVTGFGTGTGTVTTNSTTAVASNGTPPYTYAWTLTAWNTAVLPTATNPASDTTAFTQTSMGPGDLAGSTWTVTATDDNGSMATAQVNASFAETP